MKISLFEKIVSIDSFVYVHQVDRHEECRFSVSVAEKNIKDCAAKPGDECSVEHDGFKFSGIVTEIAKIHTFTDWRLEVVLTGKTLKFDKEKKRRVFQNDKKKLADILKCTGMSETDVTLKNDDPIEEIIVQDNETDWAFALRMAKYLGAHLFPAEKTWIGSPKNQSEDLKDEDMINSRICFMEKGESGICRIKKSLEFGQKVSVEGTSFFVDSVIFRKEKEEYLTEYHLTGTEGEEITAVLPVHVLPAKVKDNDDPDKKGRVTVEFLEPYEDAMKDDAMWIETDCTWASQTKGLVCIPFVDDEVLVRITGGRAGIEASRRTESFDSRYEDCNTRYIFVNDKIHLAFNEEKLVLDNSKLRLELSEENLSVKFGDKVNIKLDENGITLNTDKSSVEITSTAKLKTKSFEVDGGDNADITASKVNIKGNSGVSIN